MKKIISLTIAAMLLISTMAFPAFAADVEHNVSITTNNVTISGSGVPALCNVLLKVFKPGVAAASATDDDIIYYNIVESDDKGEFSFNFTLAELRGTFEYTLICTDASYNESGEFTYNPTGDSEIKSFSLGGMPCTINGNSITLNVSAGTNVTGLIATFVVQEDALVYVGSTLQQSGYTRNNFSTPVVYKVVADDGSEREYTVTVTGVSISIGGGSSGGSSGGGGGGGGGNVVSSTPSQPGQSNTPDPIKRELFVDVPEDHWAYDYIDYLVEKGIISGYEGNEFRPENDITRAEFVKIIVNAFDVVPGDSEVSFGDVGENDWFKYYIDLASSNGLVTGDDKGNFNPDAPITREDMAVIIKRAADYAGIKLSAESETEFADAADISSYALSAIKSLNAAGIISGYPDGTIRPGANASRAEACAMIFKVLTL